MTISKVTEQFFSAFSKLDFNQMANLLSEDILYYDPIFGLLEGEPVFDLWQMRCERLKQFSFSVNNIEELDTEYSTCQWSISFFHRPAGKVITQHGKSHMRIIDGKITEQSEGYKLSDWLAAAYGWKGKLFGWTGDLKRKEQNNYRKMLDHYISNKSLFINDETRSHDYDYSDR